MKALALVSLANDLLDLLAPPTCASCGAIATEPQSALRVVLCGHCHDELEPASPQTVAAAAHALPLLHRPWAHQGALARAIHRAKYQPDAACARALGVLLAMQLSHANVSTRFDVLVPVPLHRRRQIQRGFNQSAELCRTLGVRMDQRAIRRVRNTPPQVGLGRAERMLNVLEAFEAVHPDALKGQRVLLVDDVITTGATMHEAVHAVMQAGAKDVSCVALSAAALVTGT